MSNKDLLDKIDQIDQAVAGITGASREQYLLYARVVNYCGRIRELLEQSGSSYVQRKDDHSQVLQEKTAVPMAIPAVFPEERARLENPIDVADIEALLPRMSDLVDRIADQQLKKNTFKKKESAVHNELSSEAPAEAPAEAPPVEKAVIRQGSPDITGLQFALKGEKIYAYLDQAFKRHTAEIVARKKILKQLQLKAETTAQLDAEAKRLLADLQDGGHKRLSSATYAQVAEGTEPIQEAIFSLEKRIEKLAWATVVLDDLLTGIDAQAVYVLSPREVEVLTGFSLSNLVQGPF